MSAVSLHGGLPCEVLTPAVPSTDLEALLRQYKDACASINHCHFDEATKALFNFSKLNFEQSLKQFYQLYHSIYENHRKNLFEAFHSHFMAQQFDLRDLPNANLGNVHQETFLRCITECFIFKNDRLNCLRSISLHLQLNIYCSLDLARKLILIFNKEVKEKNISEVRQFIALFSKTTERKQDTVTYNLLNDAFWDVSINLVTGSREVSSDPNRNASVIYTTFLEAARLTDNDELLKDVIEGIFSSIRGRRYHSFDPYELQKENAGIKTHVAKVLIELIKNISTLTDKSNVAAHLYFLANCPSPDPKENFSDLILTATNALKSEDCGKIVLEMIRAAALYADLAVIKLTFDLIFILKLQKEPTLRQGMMPLLADIWSQKYILFPHTIEETLDLFNQAILKFPPNNGLEDFFKEYFAIANSADYPTIYTLLELAMVNENNKYIELCLQIIEKLNIQYLIPLTLDCSVLLKEKDGCYSIHKVILQARAPKLEDQAPEIAIDLQNELVKFIATATYRTDFKFDYNFVRTYKAAVRCRLGIYLTQARIFLLNYRYSKDDLPKLLEIYKSSSGQFKVELRYILLSLAITHDDKKLLEQIRDENKSAFAEVKLSKLVGRLRNIEEDIKATVFVDSSLEKALSYIPDNRELDLSKCTFSHDFLRMIQRCHPQLSTIKNDYVHTPSEYSAMTLSALEMSCYSAVDISTCLPKGIVHWNYKGPIIDPSKTCSDESVAKLNALVSFEVEDSTRSKPEYLEWIIPHLTSVTQLAIGGFEVREETLNLIRKHIPHLTTFSGRFSKIINPSWNSQITQSNLTLAKVNEFLSCYQKLTKLTLDLSFEYSEQDRLFVLPHVTHLTLDTYDKSFIISTLEGYKSQLLHLSLCSIRMEDNIFEKLKEFKKLESLTILWTDMTPLQIALVCSQMTSLKVLTIQAHLSIRPQIDNIAVMLGIEVVYAR